MKHANGCWGQEVGGSWQVGEGEKKMLQIWKFGEAEVILVDVGKARFFVFSP